jgi:hypothetical protein
LSASLKIRFAMASLTRLAGAKECGQLVPELTTTVL